MAEIAFLLLVSPLLGVVDLMFWLCEPERRVIRSAAVAGLVVGKAVAGAAW